MQRLVQYIRDILTRDVRRRLQAQFLQNLGLDQLQPPSLYILSLLAARAVLRPGVRARHGPRARPSRRLGPRGLPASPASLAPHPLGGRGVVHPAAASRLRPPLRVRPAAGGAAAVGVDPARAGVRRDGSLCGDDSHARYEHEQV